MGGGKPDSSYAARYAQLQIDIGHFLDDLRTSGRRIDAPMSYTAMSELPSRLIAENPSAKPEFDVGAYTDGLPQTPLVADGAWSSDDVPHLEGLIHA